MAITMFSKILMFKRNKQGSYLIEASIILPILIISILLIRGYYKDKTKAIENNFNEEFKIDKLTLIENDFSNESEKLYDFKSIQL